MIGSGTTGAMLPGSVGLAVFLAIGLLGGAHCLGMCGPLVTLYADRIGAARSDAGRRNRDDHDGVGRAGGGPADRDLTTGGDATTDGGYRRRRLSRYELRQHLLFNLGRTASYATIGAVMGALGALAFGAAAIAAVATDLRAIAGVLVGGFILLTGAGYLASGSSGPHRSIPLFDGALDRVFSRASTLLVARVDAWARGPRIAGLGAIHGLLPCPILYPAFLYALARGSPVEGALSLAVLGLGTVPTLLAYGTLASSLDAMTRRRLHRALGVAFLVLGYIPLSHGLTLLGVSLPHPTIPVYQPFG